MVKAYMFDKGKAVIDWKKNEDIKGKMRIAMDDLLFEAKSQYGLAISFDEIDQLIARCIKVSETKYRN